jgi:hypothetical protein
MNEQELFNDLLSKILVVTNRCYQDVVAGNYETINEDIENRGRLLGIIESLQERLIIKGNNSPKFAAYNNQVNQVISKIQYLDEEMTKLMEEARNKTQNQIAKAFKNKENLKGYNLNKLNR